jgi:hypothetical protein
MINQHQKKKITFKCIHKQNQKITRDDLLKNLSSIKTIAINMHEVEIFEHLFSKKFLYIAIHRIFHKRV